MSSIGPSQIRKALLFVLATVITVSPQTALSQASDSAWTRDQSLAYMANLDMMDMVGIPMRDGVVLSSRIYFPEIEREDLPTVLIRSPYHIPRSESQWFAQEIATFLRHGYAVVINSERGRYWSEGEYSFLVGARNDGYDVVDWITRQPWSNGKVGTWGCSSSAEHQLGLAAADHPGHAAMIALAAGAGIGEVGAYHPQGMLYRGGVIQMPWVRWYYQYGFNEFPTFGDSLSRDDRLRLQSFYDPWATKPEVDWKEALRHLPLIDQIDRIGGLRSDFRRFVSRLPNDPAWHDEEFAGARDTFGVPALHINSWYDISFGPSSMALLEYMKQHATDEEAASSQFMVIAATDHCGQSSETANHFYGDRSLGDARFDYWSLYVDWFDYWLKGDENGVVNRPEIQLYTMGKNQWEYFDAWPPRSSEPITYFLRSESGARSKQGDGTLESKRPQVEGYDEYVYDPSNPVPSLGDNDWGMIPELESGSYDQSPVEMRNDVLVYTTPILDDDIQATGPVRVVVYLSSNVPDTDVTAKLVDVYPDGRAFNVAESIQRVRWRNGYEEPAFMEEGRIHRVEIGPLLTSNLFKAGHRIRLEISSSNFPRFERNLNTGGNNYDEVDWRVATNRVHWGGDYSSHLILMVVPRE